MPLWSLRAGIGGPPGGHEGAGLVASLVSDFPAAGEPDLMTGPEPDIADAVDQGATAMGRVLDVAGMQGDAAGSVPGSVTGGTLLANSRRRC
ncbi:hypothetical protein Ate01nite_31020 [Actinoplanes teichomyceticus]|nr:hypothetical protein Ate01nite_31020 [Actinoplanes teichomyceticus]